MIPRWLEIASTLWAYGCISIGSLAVLYFAFLWLVASGVRENEAKVGPVIKTPVKPIASERPQVWYPVIEPPPVNPKSSWGGNPTNSEVCK
jgi:hypothetical protein